MKAIFKRELHEYFSTLLGYVFMFVFLAVSGIFFWLVVVQYQDPTIAAVLSYSEIILILLTPILTMRLFAAERQTKSDQLLLTSPVSITGIVLGKFFAAYTVFAASIALTLLYLIPIILHSRIIWGEIICAYIGYLLIGLCYVSVGVFASSLTSNQIISALIGFAILLVTGYLVQMIPQTGIELVDSAVEFINIPSHYTDFSRGMISLGDVVYYLSVSAALLFLTGRSVEKRRWS